MSPSSLTLFSPLAIRGVVFPNRVIVSPMCQYSAIDGLANDWHWAHHARFALGGVGGAIVEATAIEQDGRITPGCLGIWSEAHIEPLRKITSIYRSRGIPVGIQLAHAGRKGSAATPAEGAAPLSNGPRPSSAWQTVGPSAIPLMDGWPTPLALTNSHIRQIIGAFAAAATRAVRAGFDFVEIHGAHGYLIHSFLSSISNQRDDAWGGDRERRFRFCLEVTDAIRAVIPESMPVFTRLSCVDAAESADTLDDTIQLVKALSRRGVDLVDCSAGGIAGPSGRASVPMGPAYLAPFAQKIARESGLLTMATGLIDTPQLAAQVIDSGEVALLAIGRQLLADPAFAYRAALELGQPNPEQVLPPQYALFLKRKHSR